MSSSHIMYLEKNDKLSNLFLIYPALVFLDKYIGMILLSIIMIYAIYTKTYKSQTKINLDFAKFYLIIFLLCVPQIFIDNLNLKSLDPASRYLLFAIALILISDIKIKLEHFFYSICIGACIGFIIYYIYIFQILDLYRFDHHKLKKIFIFKTIFVLNVAYFSLIYMCISAVSMYYASVMQNKKLYIISFISIIMSFLIGIASASKVVVLGYPIALILICMSLYHFKLKNKKLIIITAAIALIFTANIFKDSPVYERYKYEISKINSKEATSTNLRIDMIKLGWHAFKQNPILGSGYKNLANIKKDAYESGITNTNFHNDNDDGSSSLHNEFINLMAKKGILGILILLLLYCYPIKYAWKLYDNSKNENYFSFVTLIVFSVSTFLIGLTEHFLYYDKTALLYAFFMYLIISTFKEEINAKSK